MVKADGRTQVLLSGGTRDAPGLRGVPGRERSGPCWPGAIPPAGHCVAARSVAGCGPAQSASGPLMRPPWECHNGPVLAGEPRMAAQAKLC